MFNANEHLMDLKGKQYLQVMWRLVWFREEKPLWSIDTKLEQLTENHAVFSAKVSDENGVQKASGYGSESVKDFRDFIEKAETKAIGRALAMLGYGTQFAPELDEGERIVDSPVSGKTGKLPPILCQRCGKPIMAYNGKAGKFTAEQIAGESMKAYHSNLCWNCMRAVKKAKTEQTQAEQTTHEDAG